MKYAVTAATGRFGTAAVNTLVDLVGKENVVAIVRNPDKGKQQYPDLEVRVGDYGKPDQLKQAFTGIDRVLFISSQPGGEVTRDVQHKNVVNARKDAGVQFVAYTSYPHADEAKNGLARDHKLTEEAIRDAGLAHTFLRDNWYLGNELGFFKAGQEKGIVTYWTDKKTGWALEREYAEAAAKVLVSDSPEDVYEFAGPARTYEELAQGLSEALGKDIEAKLVKKDDYVAGLEETGLDHETAVLYGSFAAPTAEGDLGHESNDLETVLGHPLTSLPEAIKETLNM